MNIDLANLRQFDNNQITKLRRELLKLDKYFKSNDQRIKADFLFCTACEEIESVLQINEIFICDMCATQVHQKCYGEDLLSFTEKENNWYCERCLALIEAFKNGEKEIEQIKCALCPETNQMLRKVKITDNFEVINIWVHLSCIRKVPTIQVATESGDEYQISLLSLLQNSDESIFCTFCKLNYGYIQQCAYKNCQNYFHIGCAKTHGILIHEMGMKSIYYLLEACSSQVSENNIYCYKHIDIHTKSLIKVLGEEKGQILTNQTQVVMKYRWEKWYQWNCIRAERFNLKEYVYQPPKKTVREDVIMNNQEEQEDEQLIEQPEEQIECIIDELEDKMDEDQQENKELSIKKEQNQPVDEPQQQNRRLRLRQHANTEEDQQNIEEENKEDDSENDRKAFQKQRDLAYSSKGQNKASKKQKINTKKQQKQDKNQSKIVQEEQ